MWGVLENLIRVPFRVFLIGVPHYFGDLEIRDPNLENYPRANIRLMI